MDDGLGKKPDCKSNGNPNHDPDGESDGNTPTGGGMASNLQGSSKTDSGKDSGLDTEIDPVKKPNKRTGVNPKGSLPLRGAVIVAGGSGRRMGGGVPKQFLPLGIVGKPVIVHAIERFMEALPAASPIVVVIPRNETLRFREIAQRWGIWRRVETCTGGKTRFESVRNGLKKIDCRFVAIHDGARPLVSGELIRKAFDMAREHGSAIPCVRPSDSFRADCGGGITRVFDRDQLMAVQTPQVFLCEKIRMAYETPFEPRFTDDAGVFEAAGFDVRVCEGEARNIKITTPFDMAAANILLGTGRRPHRWSRRSNKINDSKLTMEQRFRYRRDKRTRRRTWLISALMAAAFACVALFVAEEYLRAWLIVFMFALLLLYILSIPRYIKVDRESLEIHCIVELTRIAIGDINSVRKVTRQDTGKLTPVLGSYGFFGYFGYFVNFKRWEIMRVYASEWNNLVEIEDIYEDKYLVSCREADRLIEMVMQAKLIGPAAEEESAPRE